MDKDLTWKPDPNRREALLANHRASMSGCKATRWEEASTFWMLATGCALAAVVMLYVSGGR